MWIVPRLREKADEEDSDADDEELPLTAEEKAEEQTALEKHVQDCEKVSIYTLGDQSTCFWTWRDSAGLGRRPS